MAFFTSSTYLVRYILTGNATSAVAAMKKTGAEAELAGAKVARVGDTLSKTGRSLLAATLPLAGLGAVSVKTASDFTQAMTRVRTQGQATQAQATSLAKGILAMTGQVGFSATDLANSLNLVLRSGIPASKALTVLGVAARGAKIGGDDLVNTTDALTSVMNAGLKGTHNYAQVMQVLDQAIAHGKLSLSGLTSALGNSSIVGEAKLFGVSLQDITSVLAGLSKVGTLPGRFATNMKFFLDRMVAADSFPKAAAGLASIGISAKQLSDNLQTHGLMSSLRELRDHLKHLDTHTRDVALTNIFGGSRGISTVGQQLVFLNTILKTNAAIKTASAGQFAQRWALQNKTTAQQLDDAKAVLNASLIKLGVTITPAVMKAVPVLVKAITGLVDAFDGLPKPIRDSFVYLTVLAVVVGTVMVIFGKLFKAIGLVRMGFEWLVALFVPAEVEIDGMIIATEGLTVATLAMYGAMTFGVVAAVAGIVILYNKWRWFHNAVDNTFNWFKKNWATLGKILIAPLWPLVLALREIIQNFDKIKHFTSGVGKGVGTGIKILATPITAPINFARGLFRSGGSVRHMLGGGTMIGGGYGGGDIVPMMGEPGEFVLRKEAVSSLGANRLQALNAGFDSGGGTLTIEPAPVIINLDGRKLAEGVVRYAARKNALAGGGG